MSDSTEYFNLKSLDTKTIGNYINRIISMSLTDNLSKHELYSIALIEQEFLKWGVRYTHTLSKVLKYKELEQTHLSKRELDSIIKIQKLWRGKKSREKFMEYLKELSTMEVNIPKLDF